MWLGRQEPAQPSSRPSPQMVGFTSVASQQTAHQNQQPFPMHTIDFASGRSRNTSVASQQTPNQNQPFPMLRSILQAAAQETHQWHRTKHQIKTSHSPCRRSILQAAAQETHQWHRTKHQIKTSHSPCRRSTLQAAAQETHQWHRTKHQINTSHSPCRHSILQAGTQETTSDLSGIAAKSKSKPAILVYKHVRGSRLTRFSRIPNCTLDLGRLRAWTLQETNTADHHLGSLFPHVHTETQRPHNKASPEGLALPRTKRNDLRHWEY